MADALSRTLGLARALLTLGLVGLDSPSAGVEPGEVAELLAAAGASQLDEPDLRRRLLDLGPEAIPDLFAHLAESAPERAPGDAEGEWEDEDEDEDEPVLSFTLEPGLRAVVRSVLGAQREGQVRAFLGGLVLDEATELARITAVELLRECPGQDDVSLLVTLVHPREIDAGIGRPLRKAYGATLRAILERDASALGSLERRLAFIDPALLAETARAVSVRPSRSALAFLVDMLGRAACPQVLVLTRIARLGASLPRPVSADTRGPVRGFLAAHDPEVLKAAVRAAAGLEDYDSVPELIELLRHHDSNVAWTAHRALVQITGFGYVPQHDAWDAWYRSELDWWRTRSESLARDLAEGDKGAATAALFALCRRRVHRHRAAEILMTALERSEPDLVRLGCVGLRELGSATAVPALIDCLEHPRDDVKEAAWITLKSITGEELPPDASAWRESAR